MDPNAPPRSRIVPWEELPPHIRLMVPRPAPEATPEPPPPAPGLLSMATSFVGAVATHLLDDGRPASPEAQAEREATCRACPHHDHVKDACLSCGCGTIPALSFLGLDLEMKRSWASSRCPDTPPRWGPDTL